MKLATSGLKFLMRPSDLSDDSMSARRAACDSPSPFFAAAITPVPGGVGPMTVAMLLRNTLAAARLAAGSNHDLPR